MTDPRTPAPGTGLEAGATHAIGAAAGAAQSPAWLFWRQFRKSPLGVAGGALLLLFYAIALFAPFLAPYAQDTMDRERFYHPPQRIHVLDAAGRFRAPFVYATTPAEASGFAFREDPAHIQPLRFFVRGEPYRLFGFLPANLHLFGLDPPAHVFLLGADPFGRDVLSRLLFGAQISLTVGLVGIAISFTLGLLLGGISGYFGGWVDNVVMRGTELLLSIPGLYLIIALRAVFPVNLPSQQVYLAIVAILAFIGWAGLARVIRGMVLSLRRQEFVAAAEALGVPRLRIIARHILPNTMSFVIVAATLSIPGYILGEVFLSFLGVGVQEPAASWGNMLNQARTLRVLTSFPWLLWAPGTAIFLTVMAFNFFGDGLRDALDPRRVPGGKAA
jgi:peptide/nickel transport system permease protein